MAEILESTMLICFGLSWPMNLAKNIKAKSAKTMSVQFILLIIAGYIAGISAKLYNHKFNYVLAVYLLNLVIVSANLAVYFINKRYDRLAEKANSQICRELAASTEQNFSRLTNTTNNQGDDEMAQYRELNNITDAGGVVLFGSNTFASLPVGELTQAFRITESIYNRSIKDIRIDQIESYLKVCLYDLNPRKIFVNLGDMDILDENINVGDFISKYEWLLYMIHTKTQAAIYIVSIISDKPVAQEINKRLKQLAAQTGCKYIDTVSALESKRPTLRLFELLKVHMRNHPINFADAIEVGTLSNREYEDVPSDGQSFLSPNKNMAYVKH